MGLHRAGRGSAGLIYQHVGSQLGAGYVSAEAQSQKKKGGAHNGSNHTQQGVESRLASGINCLPLGAKVAATFVLAVFAASIFFGGGLSDRYAYWRGLGVAGLLALIIGAWWLGGP